MLKRLCFIIISVVFCYSYANDDTIEIRLEIKDHIFFPKVIEAPKDSKIRLIVKNEDDLVEEFESHDLRREKLIPPKSEVIIMIPPLEAGEYKFFGEFHQDTAQGVLNIK